MKICILTIVKNEQEYLDEWIKYHLDLGVDHIFVFEDIDSGSHEEITRKYTNNVTLNKISSILNAEEMERVVTLKQTKKSNPQSLYIKNGLSYIKNIAGNDYDWCFVIDCDEFITLENQDNNLVDIVSLYNGYDAFVMQWKCYGANGLIKKPDYKNRGVVDTYLEESKGYVPTVSVTNYTKTCYNMHTYNGNFIREIGSAHQPSDECNFCKTDFSKNRHIPTYKNVYIRHYITKSWEEYVWKRKVRGFLMGKIRTFDFFFKVNPDMIHLKEKLVSETKNEFLVVLPYVQKESQGNEIRLALKSWKKFCTFDCHFIVIGEFDAGLKDEFLWVEFIYCETLPPKKGQYNPHLDVLHKREIVMNMYKNAYDGFIRMVDDNYAIKPFTLDDILKTHFHALTFDGDEESPASFWSHDKWKTKQLLDREKLPDLNYSIHYPCYFEFKKLKEIWDKFNMQEESYVMEDIYFNYFPHEEPILDSTVRLGVWNKNNVKERFKNAVDNPNIKFVCNSVDGWCPELETELEKIIN